MVPPFDIKRLTPRERIELAEQLWDSLTEKEVELTAEQSAELERRRDRLAREGLKGRPWRDVLDEFDKRGG
jgi:putative addiction module component (TIGR02574 family)